MKISIIIPTYNEAANIGFLIDHLKAKKGNTEVEIIVSDGGSQDQTVEIARERSVVVVTAPEKGRAAQMNYGAGFASGEILYFLHADTKPPETYITSILNAVNEGYEAGCFAYDFESDAVLLKINAFFTRYNGVFSGGGDQSLYVTKTLFTKTGGFNERYMIMEDFEYTKRLKREGHFHVIQKKAKVSSRKYENNNYIKVNMINLTAMILFWAKVNPLTIQKLYQNFIKK